MLKTTLCALALNLLLLTAASLSVMAPHAATPVQAQAAFGDEVKRFDNDIKHKDPQVRERACEALGRTGNDDAVARLLTVIEKDADWRVQRAAGDALRHLTGDKALDNISKRVKRLKGGSQLFEALYILTGVAKGVSEKGDALVSEVVKDKPANAHMIAAGLEAIAQANRHNLNGLVEHALGVRDKKWEGDLSIAPITAASAAGRIANAENRLTLMTAIAHALGHYHNVDRVKYFLATAAGTIAKEPPYGDPAYWHAWVARGGQKTDASDGGRTQAPTRKPEFFGAEVIGKRIVFCIDISGSMSTDVDLGPLQNPPEAEKPKGPVTGDRGGAKDGKDKGKDAPAGPDYSKVKTKLDLAKVELIHTLNLLDDNYFFNVVLYETEHTYLISSVTNFVKATRAERTRFIDAVRKLQPMGATNMRGALHRSFKVTDKGPAKNDPAWDADAIASGADTIFFLTDGTPTIDDDKVQFGDMGSVENHANLILMECERMNTFRRAVIHTVGIGPHYGPILTGLSRISGGNYRDLTGR